VHSFHQAQQTWSWLLPARHDVDPSLPGSHQEDQHDLHHLPHHQRVVQEGVVEEEEGHPTGVEEVAPHH